MNKQLVLFTLMLLLGTMVVSAAPLSVIDASYLNFDSTISGPVWLINVRGDNDASYVLFGDDKSLEASIDGETATPSNDFSLVQNIESEACEYQLSGSALRNDIYTYEIDKIANNVFFTRVNDFQDECYESAGGVLAWGSGGPFQDVYCLRESNVAKAGVISEGKINFNAKFILQKGSEAPLVKSISTLATDTKEIPSSIVFTDGSNTVARIRWIGGSTFGENCPGQDNLVAIETSSGWSVGDKDAYTLYNEQYVTLNELKDKILDQDDITRDERRDLERLVAAVNERGAEALVPGSISVSGVSSTIYGSKAVVTLPKDYLIYAPDFQLLLSADWIEITFQTGKPKIVVAGFNR